MSCPSFIDDFSTKRTSIIDKLNDLDMQKVGEKLKKLKAVEDCKVPTIRDLTAPSMKFGESILLPDRTKPIYSVEVVSKDYDLEDEIIQYNIPDGMIPVYDAYSVETEDEKVFTPATVHKLFYVKEIMLGRCIDIEEMDKEGFNRKFPDLSDKNLDNKAINIHFEIASQNYLLDDEPIDLERIVIKNRDNGGYIKELERTLNYLRLKAIKFGKNPDSVTELDAIKADPDDYKICISYVNFDYAPIQVENEYNDRIRINFRDYNDFKTTSKEVAMMISKILNINLLTEAIRNLVDNNYMRELYRIEDNEIEVFLFKFKSMRAKLFENL